MTNEDETRNRPLEILVFSACLTLMFIIGVGLYCVRSIFPYVGYVVIGVVIIGLLCGAGVMIEFTVRRFTRFTFRDIGEKGTIAHRHGRVALYAPQSGEPVKAIEERAKVKVQELPPVPTVAQLLQEGALGTADLLLGYQMNGVPLWGVWGNINTFCVAGRSRSGKTITLFFIIIQALLNGAIVWIADPHGNGRKASAMKKLLDPLARYVRFAVTDEEIANMVDEFIDVMQARQDGLDNDLTPRLFVCDEFNGAAEECERLYELVNRCAREWAGYNGFAAIAGHEWTQGGKLLVKMRRNLHAKFVHKLDKDYAKFLLNSRKHAVEAEKLRTGNNFFQDVEGNIVELRTPLGTAQDAAVVAEMLLQIAGPEPRPELEPVRYHQQLTDGRETGYERNETVSFQPETDFLSLPEPETKPFQGRNAKVEEIKRLRSLGFNQSQIIQNIWKVKPGASQTYQTALAEYKQLLEEIVKGA